MRFQTKRKGTKFTTYAFEGRKCVGRGVSIICVYGQDGAIISDLFVRPEQRGKGYGRIITEECLRQVLQFNIINRVFIQDGSDNGETARIALKLGFTLTQEDNVYLYRRPRG